MISTTPLILQNIRVRGLGDVIDSKWIEVGKKITFLHVPLSFNSRGFFEALESVNPPYDILENAPFAEYPTIYRQGKIQKRVRPHRRTIALTIFIAQPEMVKDLGTITQDLYEVDRVEVGRRMNYTRWVNFVELASSSRWSEVRDEIERLKELLNEKTSHKLRDVEQLFKDTDRLIDGKKDFLLQSLETIELAGGDERIRDSIHYLRDKALRQDYFSEAKKRVREVLPQFHYLGHMGEESENENVLSPSEMIKRVEKILSSTYPVILLLDLNHSGITLDDLTVFTNLSSEAMSNAQLIVSIPENLLPMSERGTHITIDEIER